MSLPKKQEMILAKFLIESMNSYCNKRDYPDSKDRFSAVLKKWDKICKIRDLSKNN